MKKLKLQRGNQTSEGSKVRKSGVDEKIFRFLLNEDAMATEKLAEGIRKFAADTIKLEQYIKNRILHNNTAKK